MYLSGYSRSFDKESISYQTIEDHYEEKMKFNRVAKQHVLVQKKITRRVTK